MVDLIWLLVIGSLVVFWLGWAVYQQNRDKQEAEKLAAMSPEERACLQAERQERVRVEEEQIRVVTWGPLNPAMACPHCQAKGTVRTTRRDVKKGISGGKATAALVTSGLSVLAVGLSRVETVTQA